MHSLLPQVHVPLLWASICQRSMSLSPTCMTLTPRTVPAPPSEPCQSRLPSFLPTPHQGILSVCSLQAWLPPVQAACTAMSPPLLQTSSLGTLAHSACSHLGTWHPPGHRLTGAATPVFFQSHLNGDSAEQRDSPGESWQHHGAAQPQGAGAARDPAKGQGMAGQGELQQTPSKQRAPALGLPDGTRARLNSLLGKGEWGGRGVSLHPFICLHIWGCFFLLEVLLHLTPPG